MKQRRIVIESPAKADLAVAVRWYKQIQPGLENDFRLCVRAIFHRIARNPELYPVINRHLRRALTERFPYAVFYLPDGEIVRIFAILHTSRSPRIWQARKH